MQRHFKPVLSHVGVSCFDIDKMIDFRSDLYVGSGLLAQIFRLTLWCWCGAAVAYRQCDGHLPPDIV